MTQLSEELKVKEDSQGQVIIDGLTEIEVTSFIDLVLILGKGETNRCKRNTVFNERSSRSHTIAEFILSKNGQCVSKLALCDLAGNERSTGEQVKDKAYFSELRTINLSLTALGK